MVKFDEIAQSVNVRVDPTDTDLDIYVGLEHLDPESLKIRRWGTPEDVIGQKLGFKKGDIIFGKRRAYQRKLAVAEFDGICSAHAMVLRPKTDLVTPEFLPFLMQSDMFMNRAVEISVGSLSPTINWKTLRVQEFPLPPKDEQCRIAEILWAADGCHSVIRDSIPQCRLSQKVVFRDFARNSCKSSHKTVGDAILRVIAGKSPQGSSNPANDDEYGVLKVSAVGEHGFVERENKSLINQSGFNPELEVRADFLLVTRANANRSGVGRACVVAATRTGLMLSDKTLRLVDNPKRVRQRFLLQALKSRECRRHIEAEANGTEAKNISQVKLKNAPIWLPSLEEQDQVLEVLSCFDASIESLEKHLVATNMARQVLREKLLLGHAYVQ